MASRHPVRFRFRFLLQGSRVPNPPDDPRLANEPQKESNMSQKSFPELGVSAPVAAVLAARGILEPFPVQELVLPDAMSGVDVLGKSRTGSGKTLAFAL